MIRFTDFIFGINSLIAKTADSGLDYFSNTMFIFCNRFKII